MRMSNILLLHESERVEKEESMFEKKIKLMNFMIEHQGFHTATELADFMEFSVRSLKNYVYMINKEADEAVIFSSKKGYKIIEVEALKYLKQMNASSYKQIPQNTEERLEYINKKVYDGNSELDIYQLCDELYISLTTLKNELPYMNEKMANMDAYYKVSDDQLILIASEKSIRKIRNDMLFKELGQNFIDLKSIKEEFYFIDVDGLVQILKDNFKKFNIYVNEIAFHNLILHLVILIERVNDGNLINRPDSEEINIQEQLAISIICDLERDMKIVLSDGDKYEVYLILIANVNNSQAGKFQEIVSYVGDDVYQVVSEIVELIETQYGFQFKSDSFVAAFAMHLKNLFIRIKNQTFIRNPMNKIIQEKNPLIYEIALFLTAYLEKKYECLIDTNETTYLALHIGAEIERMKIETDRISTVLYCPNYLNFTIQVQSFLSKHFQDSIYVKAVLNSLTDLDKLSFDLLIVISDIEAYLPYKVIQISPFDLESERFRIEKVINHINLERKINALLANFDTYFRKEHFFLQNEQIKTREDVIRLLCDSLYEKQCVDEKFFDNIWEREKMSKTSFLRVAIPHTMKMNAIQSSVAVMICKEGINWEDCRVNLVLMIALNEVDRFKFANLYNTLVDLFCENENIRVIKDCKSFDEFELCLRRLL